MSARPTTGGTRFYTSRGSQGVHRAWEDQPLLGPAPVRFNWRKPFVFLLANYGGGHLVYCLAMHVIR